MEGYPERVSIMQVRSCYLRCWLYGSLLLSLALSTFPYVAVAQEAGAIVNVLGTAEVLRDGRWQPLAAGAAIAAGETVRTGDGSRVAIQLTNGSQLKLNANSRLELKQIGPPTQGFAPASGRVLQNVMRVLSGEAWIRTDNEPLEVQTLPATATIRGTEFNLAITGPDTARLAVLDGLVEFANPHGSVLVAANEQATAKVGEAPRKTVLLNPLDAVQWSLYYPGVISYRDYPLSGIAPSRLHQQLAAATARTQSSPRDGAAWVASGEIHYDLGLRAEAREAFTQALRLTPNNAQAYTGLGWVTLDAGEPEGALTEFEQARPAMLMSLVGRANALYRLERWEEADRVIAEAKERFPSSPLPWQQAALNHLVRGRPDLAVQDLDRAQALDDRHALTHSLRSNILLVQNRKEPALQAAQQAIAANALSPSAQLALSAVKQAEFALDDALHAAQQAVELDPHYAQALIQESRLLFGMGQVKEALALAEQARQSAPNDALVNSTWGFLQLARGQESQAIAAFEDAIAQDTTRGEPHLGLGLVLFRQNQTEQAVEQMRKATLLEPKVSLYQSYLGKAYYEVKHDALADKHLAIAKQLDPRDPTPYFYNAIRLQSVNRPIEAVQDLQNSIALNDNRAVYRSRLLLDEDAAARGATLGRIYNEVGFEQRALQEGQKSLASDPADHSAHRLLADSYAAIPRHEIARASELLQSQLLQPLNITPVQPQLAETDLLIPEGAGPSALSLNEFNPLFVRDRWSLLASGVAGNNSTWGDEVVVSGITDRFSYSLGQFHYETDGFRENNDLQHDIYNAFAQFAVTPELSLQAEFRRRETEQGDLRLNFDADDFAQDDRRTLMQNTYRLGIHWTPSSQSDVLVSYIYADREEQLDVFGTIESPTFRADFDFGAVAEDQGYQLESQYLLRTHDFNLIAGAGSYDIDVKQRSVTDFSPFPCLLESCKSRTRFSRERDNAYVYTHFRYPDRLLWTVGLSYDAFAEGQYDTDELHPKFGLQWNINDMAQLRLAAFQALKSSLVVEQTLEPTEIAGFNQFFDDTNGTRSRRYGIGIDTQFNDSMYLGIEASRREIERPILDPVSLNLKDKENEEEDLYRAYLYWALLSNWAISAEYEHEIFERDEESPSTDELKRIDTAVFPLGIRYIDPKGFFAELKATYVNQKVERSLAILDDSESLQDDFFLFDTAIGYRFPKRQGIISLQVLNVFDEEFDFQDVNYQTSEAKNPRFIPDRTLFLRFILGF
jgi:Flp pilus assembly protein TadD